MLLIYKTKATIRVARYTVTYKEISKIFTNDAGYSFSENFSMPNDMNLDEVYRHIFPFGFFF